MSQAPQKTHSLSRSNHCILLGLLAGCVSPFVYAQAPPAYRAEVFAGTYSPGDGPDAKRAMLLRPRRLYVYPDGRVILSEFTAPRIREWWPNGSIRTIAGNGYVGGATPGEPATRSPIYYVEGVVEDRRGGFYFSDVNVAYVRHVDASGINTLIAGNNGSTCGPDGAALETAIGLPDGLTLNNAGHLVIVERSNSRIRVLENGRLRTLAGTCTPGFSGDGGPANQAQLRFPSSAVFDSDGTMYIADRENHRIRAVSPAGVIRTVAGSEPGFSGDGGDPLRARLAVPDGVAIGPDGNLYIADTDNHRIRRVLLRANPPVIETFAGTGQPGYDGDGGQARSAMMFQPSDLGFDRNGNLFFSDTRNNLVRRISPEGIIQTVAGFPRFLGERTPPRNTLLHFPSSVAVDRQGRLLVADSENFRVRAIDATASTILGNGSVGNVNFSSSPLETPLHPNLTVAVLPSGRTFILSRERIFERLPQGEIVPFAGSGIFGSDGDGGPAVRASLRIPWSLAEDPAGNIYITDRADHRVRVVTPNGMISSFAGTGQAGYAGDGGPATAARFNEPTGIAMDGQGNVYIADNRNRLIRRVNRSGLIDVFSGTGSALGDGGPALRASFSDISNLAMDSNGNLWVADRGTHRIRRISPFGRIDTIMGTGGVGSLLGPGTETDPLRIPLGGALGWPLALAHAPDGTVYVADSHQQYIYKLSAPAAPVLQKISGDQQTAMIGSTLRPLQFRLTQSDSTPLANRTALLSVTRGAASLPASVTTNANGEATIPVSLGAIAGPVYVTATVDGVGVLVFHLLAVSPDTPLVSGIVNAASFRSLAGQSGAGSWITLFGSNLAATEAFPSGSLSNLLGGTQLLLGSTPLLLSYASPGQINAFIPREVEIGATRQLVVNRNGALSPPLTLRATRADPGIFLFPGSNRAVAFAADGSLIGPDRPPRPGEVIVLYGTGFGAVSPEAESTQPAPLDRLLRVAGETRVLVNGVECRVEFSGLTPGSVGLYQINFVLPPNLQSAPARLSIQVSGENAQEVQLR